MKKKTIGNKFRVIIIANVTILFYRVICNVRNYRTTRCIINLACNASDLPYRIYNSASRGANFSSTYTWNEQFVIDVPFAFVPVQRLHTRQRCYMLPTGILERDLATRDTIMCSRTFDKSIIKAVADDKYETKIVFESLQFTGF